MTTFGKLNRKLEGDRKAGRPSKIGEVYEIPLSLEGIERGTGQIHYSIGMLRSSEARDPKELRR